MSDAEVAEQKKFKLINLRTLLSHLHKFLEAFDPHSAVIFADRTHSKVDHRMMHEHLESMVADAERGQNFLG
jgi:LmbE family N-acetylglucosaminyl deacetylase